MKTLKWIQINGIAIIVVAMIHFAATPIVMKMAGNLPHDFKIVYLFMFFGTGLATLIPGLVIVMMKNELSLNSPLAEKLLALCSYSILLLGIGAVCFLSKNPFSYIILILGITLLTLRYLLKKTN